MKQHVIWFWTWFLTFLNFPFWILEKSPKKCLVWGTYTQLNIDDWASKSIVQPVKSCHLNKKNYNLPDYFKKK
jgi:hypothetical protein